MVLLALLLFFGLTFRIAKCDHSSLCPFQTNSIQIFDTKSCQLYSDTFQELISRTSDVYGKDRSVVMLIADAEAGEGKSTFLSLLLRCPSQFKSACNGEMEGVTHGVWTHDEPLTCCALLLINNVTDTSSCKCTCHRDHRDLNATANNCPLIFLMDVEGTESEDISCSLTPFYLVSQAHLHVIRKDRVTLLKAIRGPLTLVRSMQQLLPEVEKEVGRIDYSEGLNYELHILNLASTSDIVDNLRAGRRMKPNDISIRDEVFSFYGNESRIVEVRTEPVFTPPGIVDVLLKTKSYKCVDDETQQKNIQKLFVDHVNEDFRRDVRQYLKDKVSSLTGAVLPGQGGTSMTLFELGLYLPLLVNTSLRVEQGFPISSLAGPMRVAKCIKSLTDKPVKLLADEHRARADKMIQEAVTGLDVDFATAEFSGYALRRNIVEILPADCFGDSGALFAAAQPSLDVIVSKYELALNAIASSRLNSIHQKDKSSKERSEQSGIFGDGYSRDALYTTLTSLNRVSVPTLDGDALIYSGLQLTIDEALAKGYSHPLGNDLLISVYKLIIPAGVWVIYAPGRSVRIEAVVIECEGALNINVSGRQVLDLYKDLKASPGQNGANGTAGNDAGSIGIFATQVNVLKKGSFLLIARGSDGTSGQEGGDGPDGAPGKDGEDNYSSSYTKPEVGRGGNGGHGKPGGDGGLPGVGGRGGNGGHIDFLCRHVRVGSVDSSADTIDKSWYTINASGGQSGAPVVGGKGGIGGKRGNGGNGSTKDCSEIDIGVTVIRHDCKVHFGGNKGKDGDPGRNGTDRSKEFGPTGSDGAMGKINISVHNGLLCERVSVTGIASALQYIRLELLMSRWDSASTVAEELRIFLGDCSGASPLLMPLWNELQLLLWKIDKRLNVFGRKSDAAPALGPSCWLGALDDMFKSLMSMGRVSERNDKHEKHMAESLISLKNMQKTQELLLQRKQDELEKESAYIKQLDKVLVDTIKDLGDAEEELNVRLFDFNDIVNRAREFDSQNSKWSLNDTARIVLTQTISWMWNDDNVSASYATPAATGGSDKGQGTETVFEEDGMLYWGSTADVNFKSSGRREVKDLLLPLEDYEEEIRSRLSVLSQVTSGHPAVLDPLRHLRSAVMALLSVRKKFNMIISRRESSMITLNHTSADISHLESLIAISNAGDAKSSIEWKSVSYSNWLRRQSGATLFEFALDFLDNACRALCLKYTTNIRLSNTFSQMLSGLLENSENQKNWFHQVVSAMEGEDSRMKIAEINAKEVKGKYPEPVTVNWPLPAWAVEHLTSVRSERLRPVVLELPYDAPVLNLLNLVTVTSVKVLVSSRSALSSPQLFQSFRFKILHLGSCASRRVDGTVVVNTLPIRDPWTKQLLVDGYEPPQNSDKIGETLGVFDEYNLLLATCTWQLSFVPSVGERVDAAAADLLSNVTSIVLNFEGFAYTG